MSLRARGNIAADQDTSVSRRAPKRNDGQVLAPREVRYLDLHARACAAPHQRPMPTSGRLAYRLWLSDQLLNQPNRRVRTRTHGGVTGKARERSPSP